MKILGSVALVTGANRGIGRQFAQELLERGARKVYATARNPRLVDLPGAEVLPLDITDPASVAAAADAASDVTLLVNNAGLVTGSNLITGDMDRIRLELDTHFYGNLAMVRAFAPVLAAQGGGAIVNVLSALSWFSSDGVNSYAVAKAAEWSLTNGVRLELTAQGTLVTGVHVGAVDTDLMAGYDGAMVSPATVVHAALDAVEDDQLEVVVDDWSALVKASLAGDPRDFYTRTAPATPSATGR